MIGTLLLLASLGASVAPAPEPAGPPTIVSAASLHHPIEVDDPRRLDGSIGEQHADDRLFDAPLTPNRSDERLAQGGPHWPDRAEIRVWIDTVHAPSGADTLVERAMKRWSDAAGRHFRLDRTAARDAASLRVHFVGANNNVYGEAQPRVDLRTGTIVEADVHINGDIAGAGDRLSQRIVLYLTALHELGHALGLPHTDDFNTIMYSFRRPDDGRRYFEAYRQRLQSGDEVGSAKASGLAPADVDALRALYGR